MSKQIDWTQPVTGEEREWASQFATLHPMLEANAQQFPEVFEDEGDSEEAPARPDYSQWKVADLQAEINRRNDEFGTTMSSTGRHAELVQRLEEDDRTHGVPQGE
jgi:hypothetical protein